MSMFAVPGAYDRAITVFSPDGRLFQVEYASETVKRGATVLGIASPEGVVLAAEERAGSKLQDLSFMWKIFQIDEHVGTAVAGLSCDAHILVDQARIYAQSNKLMYDGADSSGPTPVVLSSHIELGQSEQEATLRTRFWRLNIATI